MPNHHYITVKTKPFYTTSNIILIREKVGFWLLLFTAFIYWQRTSKQVSIVLTRRFFRTCPNVLAHAVYRFFCYLVPISSMIYNSVSQPFWAFGTLICYKKFGGTPKSKIRLIYWKKVLFLLVFKSFLRLCGTPK